MLPKYVMMPWELMHDLLDYLDGQGTPEWREQTADALWKWAAEKHNAAYDRERWVAEHKNGYR